MRDRPAPSASAKPSVFVPEQPTQWPAGSLVFAHNTAHLREPDGRSSFKGLLGCVYRDIASGRKDYAVWRYNKQAASFTFVGHYVTWHEGMGRLD